MKVTKIDYKGFTILQRILKKRKFDLPQKPYFEIWKDNQRWPGANSVEEAKQLIDTVTE